MVSVSRIPVESSMLAAVGYDSAAKVLYAEFHSGGTYAYPDVTPKEFEDLTEAGSIGRYMSSQIIPVYSGIKVTPDRDFRWKPNK